MKLDDTVGEFLAPPFCFFFPSLPNILFCRSENDQQVAPPKGSVAILNKMFYKMSPDCTSESKYFTIQPHLKLKRLSIITV